MNFKTIILLIAAFFLSFAVFLLYDMCIIKWLLSGTIDKEIKYIVEKETSGLSTPEEKIQKLSIWLNENV